MTLCGRLLYKVIGIENNGELYQPKGKALVFHPDLLRGTSLGRQMADYFGSDKPKELGLPSVAYCADQLNLSANYFGDLIKKETGKSAQEYIQLKTMDIAKEKIFDVTKSVSKSLMSWASSTQSILAVHLSSMSAIRQTNIER